MGVSWCLIRTKAVTLHKFSKRNGESFFFGGHNPSILRQTTKTQLRPAIDSMKGAPIPQVIGGFFGPSNLKPPPKTADFWLSMRMVDVYYRYPFLSS